MAESGASEAKEGFESRRLMYTYMRRNASFHSREVKIAVQPPLRLQPPSPAINRICELERAILFVSRTIRCVRREGDG